MRGSQLARAVANIIDQKPELDAQLREQLEKWIKATLMKGASLESLRSIQATGGTEFVSWHLQKQSERDLVALTKKLDPHLPNLKERNTQFLREHLAQLSARQIEPASKSERTGTGRAAPKKPVEEILHLTTSLQRRMELEKLSPNELKAAIKKFDLGGGGLSGKPSKVEMIEHIQATLASGWPSTATALGDSKY